MPGEAIAQGLVFSVDGRDMFLRSDEVWPSLTLRFRVADGRVHTAALVLDGKHATDLSGNPSALTTMLREAALHAGANPDSWCARTAAAVATTVTALGCAAVPRRRDVTATEQLWGVVGGLRYPMLRAAYEAGASFERELPRWARPALDAGEVPEATRRLFGPAATRAVMRALGTWLQTPVADPWRLSWGALGVAVATAHAFQPDDVASVLQTLEAQAPTVLSVDDIGLLRSTASFVGRRSFKPIASEALADEVVPRLVRVCGLVRTARHVLRPPFPTRLDELERVALACVSSWVHATGRCPSP